jgi:hypothetical protein
MSRWINTYQNPEYVKSWVALRDEVDILEVKEAQDEQSLAEIVRLKKVIDYLDSILDSLDPELLPYSIWQKFHISCLAAAQESKSFRNTKNSGHLQNANNGVDVLLGYVIPFSSISGAEANILKEASVEAATGILERFASFKLEASQLLSDLKDLKSASESEQKDVQAIKERLVEFEYKTFGVDELSGSEQKIDEYFEKIRKQHDLIMELYDELFNGINGNPALQHEIYSTRDRFEEDRKTLGEELAASKKRIEELGEFHVMIFGDKTSEEKHNGLAGEIKLRREEMKNFAVDQKNQYEALVEEINSLLPGATSAGLAKAYSDMKISFDNPIKSFSRLFYGSIFVLVAISLYASIESVGGEHWITLRQFVDLNSILENILSKLPLYGPVLWIAFYASRRRSESQRLQQEYAHKEALAKSYHSYKEQIERLDVEDKDMMKSLILRAIDAIAYNASQTLDKNHGDKHPVHEAVSGITDRIFKK